MSHTHLLDTSVLSQPVKDRPSESVLEHWSSRGDDAVCTSAVCLAELLQGLESRRSTKYWRRYRELLQDRFSILPFDAKVATTFARLSADLTQLGAKRPALDLMIGATAAHHGLTVATLNARHFVGIPGVVVEDWG